MPLRGLGKPARPVQMWFHISQMLFQNTFPLRGRAVIKLLLQNDLKHSPSGRVGRGSGRRGYADPSRAYSPTLLEKEGVGRPHDLLAGR